LRLLLEKLATKAGLPPDEPINPHAFRHFAALAMRANGADVGMVAQVLGHASVSTTIALYGQFDADKLAALHIKHSPLNTLGIKS
jgi:site-specific recombinase XerD